MYNSINFLPPYFQEQPLFKDLCFFIDYLEVDIDKAYEDLRYKYIDWDKISEASVVQTLNGMGMDYIVDLINAITPSSSSQLLALCSLIWLLKGDLLGVDVIASICGFTYEHTVWHEQVPLGTPNTATIKIKFVEDRALSEDFQYLFGEFLQKYLYPQIDINVESAPCVGHTFSYGFMMTKEKFSYHELIRTPVEIDFDIMDKASEGTYVNTVYSDVKNTIKLVTDVNWHIDGEKWNSGGYYATNQIWTPANRREGSFTSPVYTMPELYVSKVQASVTYRSLSNNQYMEVYMQCSEDNVNWDNWKKIMTPTVMAFKYCRFRVMFRAIEDMQMVLYSCSISMR